jgi:hypothetical protein
MECLRSFVLDFKAIGLLSGFPGGAYRFWAVGLNYYCNAAIDVDLAPNPAIFRPQGFKNIDVYGIKLAGNFTSDPNSATSNAVITNWGARISTVGTYSQISGVFPNTLNLPVSESPVTIGLNNQNPEVEYPSPIKSVTNIIIDTIFFSAEHCQSLTDIALLSDVQLIVYYKFEGE